MLFNDNIMGELLCQSLETATPSSLDPATIKWTDSGKRPGSVQGKFTKWLTFSSLTDSVVEDVKHIRGHPLIDPTVPVYGYYYDVRTGKLVEVPEATHAGKAVA